ncbi:MAG: type III-A CRISPR-associated protein Csm2 [Armatimonadetes bacterium]|nr:type III-A CRISPR-associated protein Csm2 [Armatimonadota bacterium]
MNQQRRDDRGGRPPHQGGQQPQSAVNYQAMTDYFDEKGNLRKDVFVKWPKEIADNIRVSRTNMRRAFDLVSSMNFRIKMGEDRQAVLSSGIGSLHRFAQYQAGRDRTWDEAKRFIHPHCEAVLKDDKNFEGFYQLFQSVMAYLRR